MKHHRTISFLFILCLLVTTGGNVHAQLNPFPGSLRISVSPEHPSPQERVTFRATASNVDLERANITWRANGTIVLDGIGATTFERSAPARGQTLTVDVEVETQRGQIATQNTTVRPQQIDILWEARTYTPPWYKGKALFTEESTVLFSAIPFITLPTGATVPKDELFYTWSVNGSGSADMRGVGLHTLTLPIYSLQQEARVRVQAETLDGRFQASTETHLDRTTGELVLYPQLPLLGILEHSALRGTVNMEEDELTLTAIPYFFNTLTAGGALTRYSWNVNNTPITTEGNTETFRREDPASGTSVITIEAQNASVYRQNAETQLRIQF